MSLGFLGENYSFLTEPLASLAGRFGVPVISYTATAPSLSDNSLYPTFMRTIPPDNTQAKVTLTSNLESWASAHIGLYYVRLLVFHETVLHSWCLISLAFTTDKCIRSFVSFFFEVNDSMYLMYHYLPYKFNLAVNSEHVYVFSSCRPSHIFTYAIHLTHDLSFSSWSQPLKYHHSPFFSNSTLQNISKVLFFLTR